MLDRRKLLKTALFSATSATVVGSLPRVLAQVPRREIRIAGKRIKVVDIHAHCGIPAVEQVVRGTPLEITVGKSRILGPE